MKALSRLCMALLIPAVVLASSTVAWAATGSISASPQHLVTAKGQVGTTVVSWSTSGCSNAEVWVSCDGSAESLFARGPSGSQAAAWIVPWHWYVFRLYEGTSHTTLLAWTGVSSQYPPAEMFGFNYWPYQSSCACLTDENWTSAMKAEVRTDLDHMASLSVGVLRLMFWPQSCGWTLLPYPQGGEFTSDFDEMTDNIVELIQMCQERHLQVIICFGNNYFDCGNGDPGHRWWMNSYDEFSDFLSDTAYWVNGFVNSIEASAYKNAIIFYDYENEYYRNHPYMGWYLTFLYDWSAVPEGKRGCSVLHVPYDVDDMKYQLGISPPGGVARRLDFVDYHSYPAYPHNPDIEYCYDYCQGKFPDSTIILGEYGRVCGDSSEEAAQEATVLDVTGRAITKGICYYMNWMLWDETPGPGASTAWGYTPDSPKDVLGGMSDVLNLALNPDMEDVSGGVPIYWEAGGSVPLSFYAGGPNATEAATNDYYARIKVENQTSGSVWLVAHGLYVDGGKTLYLNSYIRSSMQNVRMNVVEYDSSWNWLRSTTGPAFTPQYWMMYNYVREVGSYSVDLLSNTGIVLVTISGEVVHDPSYLDVDAVSVWTGP